eukprot:scaffold1075_cov197-Prasinococcus_capsulatus_cf.AAC.1
MCFPSDIPADVEGYYLAPHPPSQAPLQAGVFSGIRHSTLCLGRWDIMVATPPKTSSETVAYHS